MYTNFLGLTLLYLLFSSCSWIEGKFFPSIEPLHLLIVRKFIKLCTFFSVQPIHYKGVSNNKKLSDPTFKFCLDHPHK